MEGNKYMNFHIPAGMLIIFLEKALTLIHIETHFSEDKLIHCTEPFTLLSPHHCKTSVLESPEEVAPITKIISEAASFSEPKPRSKPEEQKEEVDEDMPDDSASSKHYSNFRRPGRQGTNCFQSLKTDNWRWRRNHESALASVWECKSFLLSKIFSC